MNEAEAHVVREAFVLFLAHRQMARNVGEHEVLADLAAEVELDRAAALDVLASGAFEEEVKADE